jgi:hypothetical protein
MRLLPLLALLFAAGASTGCYVASVFPFAVTEPTEIDQALLGSWRSADDDVAVTIERDEWRTYQVTVKTRSGEARFTGRLAELSGTRLFDLTVPSGTEPGAGLLAVHIVGRVALRDGTLVVQVLDHEWFRQRLLANALDITALLDERETVLVTAPGAQWRRWLAANVKTAAAFAEPVTFERTSESEPPP